MLYFPLCAFVIELDCQKSGSQLVITLYLEQSPTNDGNWLSSKLCTKYMIFRLYAIYCSHYFNLLNDYTASPKLCEYRPILNFILSKNENL